MQSLLWMRGFSQRLRAHLPPVSVLSHPGRRGEIQFMVLTCRQR